MISQPITDDRKITLSWSTTTVLDYTATFTFRELREAVNDERAKHGYTAHTDITDDLHLLTDFWLGNFEEEDGSLADFNREITDIQKNPVPALAVFTVTVHGPERHEYQAPHTYVLHAADEQSARDLALARHIRNHGLDTDPFTGKPQNPDAAIVEGAECTFPGVPEWPAHMPGRAWIDLRADAETVTAARQIAR